MFCRFPTRAAVCLIATALTAAPAFTQYTSENISLLSQISPAQFGSESGAGCRGYVSPSGREYAVMGLNNKVAIVEITNPASPVIVGSVSHQAGLWSEVELYGHYVYASNETGGGIDIINLNNVDNGVVTLVQRMTTSGVDTTHTVTIDTVSGYLYLNGSNVGGGRLMAFSLANPEAPAFVGQASSTEGAYVHDSLVVTYDSGPYAGQQIAFCFNGSTGLDIVNVTNKANMVRLSRTEYSNLVYCHQGALSADRQYLYVDDEIDDLPYTRVFNVTNLSAPVELPQFYIGANSIDHNQYIRDGFLFQANYTSGLHIHDLGASPTNPIHVGFFDTFPGGDPSVYDGAWNVYPYFPSGNVIISDIARGLFVVDVRRALNYLTFNFPNGRPAVVSPSGGTTMRVEVSGRLASPAPGTGLLHYNAGAGYVAIPMTPVSPGVYDAVFPPFPCGTTVSYYVSVENSLGDLYTSPGTAPGASYSAEAVSSLNITVNDAFEAVSGWTGGVAGDTATTGVWVRVNPRGTAAQPENDHSDSGTVCWVTGQGPIGGGVGEADVDNGYTTLLSPVFDLAAHDAARVSYWRWYSNSQGPAPNADEFRVDVSNNNGTSWVNVETVGPTGPETGGGWYYHEFSVGDFVTLTSQVRLRFIAADLDSGSIVEAAVDDFQIREVVCDETPCPGDLNDDSVVDLADLSLLLADFGCAGGSCVGDLDGNGSTELADLTLILSAFGTACP